VSRLTIDLAYSDLEELLRLSSEDDILLEIDSELVEGLFGDYDVEAHGLKGAIAIAVTSAAILAPASQAAAPLALSPAAKTQRASVAATVQDRPAAKVQVAKTQVAKTQVAKVQVAKVQVSKTMVLRASGFQLLRSALTR
jgi:hypothetical protein